MTDPVFDNFLRKQHGKAMELAAASAILHLVADDATPPQRYIARFTCRSVIKTQGSEPRVVESQFDFGIRFPDDYLRSPEPQHVVTVFRPWSIFHPNVAGPFICLGRLTAGTSLDDILYQIYAVISYQEWNANDALNEHASEWARANQDRFPVDRRPLKWKEPRA
jgi:ubiquitin-protein ligase